MRYRDGILKIEHGILEGLKDVLLELTAVSEVSSIVPGRIYVTRGRAGGGLSVRVSTPTPTGVKLIAKRGSSVQEVFVVCERIDVVERALAPQHPSVAGTGRGRGPTGPRRPRPRAIDLEGETEEDDSRRAEPARDTRSGRSARPDRPRPGHHRRP